MFNMSDLSIELNSTEKSYSLPFKDTHLDSVAQNSLGMLPRIMLGSSHFYCHLQT